MSETLEQESGRDPATSTAVVVDQASAPAMMSQEEVAARERARRYRLEFVSLKQDEIDYHLVHELPVDLMVRHNFVPLRREGDAL
ncbi:MAG TPA: hypothetical protein VG778_01050, partial [Blastocatellia bacterium]|nr:hypothetical protein [Blastocatellia bacterium]